jgi:hypothetical protein
MAFVYTATLPPQVTLDMIQEVHAQIGDFSPDGLIAHAVIYDEAAGSVRIVDIWESERDRDSFAERKLSPAIQKVSADRGLSPQAPLSVDVAETMLLVTGRK